MAGEFLRATPVTGRFFPAIVAHRETALTRGGRAMG